MRRFLFVTTLVFAVGLTACNNGAEPNRAKSACKCYQWIMPPTAISPPAALGDAARIPRGKATRRPTGEYDRLRTSPTARRCKPQTLHRLFPITASRPAPGDNYIWTPGYWSYADAGYYWVPGAWVLAPYVGALWTPSWWGYDNGAYLWHAGYWAPAHRLLWRHRLRIWIYRSRLLRRLLE